MKLFISIFLSFWLFIFQVTAVTKYYVGASNSSPPGNDSNSGADASHPWTFTKGMNNMGPDIWIVCLDGDYSAAARLEPSKSGTPSQPTYIIALNNWKAKFSCATDVAIQPLAGTHDIVVQGLEIANCGRDGIATAGSIMTIRYCWIHDNYYQGINFSSPTVHDSVVEYNLIENNGAINDIHYHGLYLGGTNSIVRGNVVRNNHAGAGLHLYTGYAGDYVHNNWVYCNLVYGHNNFYDIVVWGANGNDGSNPGTNYVICNTAINGMQYYYGTICVTNNIVYPSAANPTTPIYYSVTHAPIAYADYNMSAKALTPNAGAHDVIAALDPGLVNTNAGLAWLKITSAARGVASPSVHGPVNFVGQTQGSVLDIGFVQYNSLLAADTRTLDPTGTTDYYWDLGYFPGHKKRILVLPLNL